MAASPWAPAGPERYGISGGGPATNAPTELSSVASPFAGADAASKPWSPHNPLFWVAAIGAVTFGLMGFSTSARVGKASGTVTIGDPKS